MNNIFDRLVSEDGEPSEPSESPGVPNPHDSVNELSGAESASQSKQTATEVKEVIQELLKHGYLEEARKSDIFRRTLVHEREILAALEPLDLRLRIDTHRGVAFLVVAPAVYQEGSYGNVDGEGKSTGNPTFIDDGAWTHPLVRRQRLTLEQSLLVAILRQAFVMHEQESGVGERAAKVAVDELLPQYMAYFGDSGSDAKNESRLMNLLDQLKTYGIVSEVDKRLEVTIRPMIAHLANPESLAALLQVLREQSQASIEPGQEN